MSSNNELTPRTRTIRRRKGEKIAEATVAEPVEEPVAAAPKAPPAPEPPPPVDVPRLDADALLAELDAMDPNAMGALLGMGDPGLPEPGQQVRGTVVRAGKETILVDIGGKSEAWIERAELGDDNTVRVGDTVEAYVVRADASGVRLSMRLSGAAAQDALHEAHESGLPVEGRVESRSSGGYSVRIGQTRAFCPISHIDRIVESDLDAYLGRTLPFRVLEIRERDVVVSHRRIAEAEAERAAEALWPTLSVGDSHDGVVANVKPFGVFVDIGGIQGLVPTREMGWAAGSEPPTRGSRVSVRILELDRDAGKVTLSLKDPALGPWLQVGTDFEVGKVYSGKVVRTTDFGAFVELAPGLQGLVHISNLADHRVERVEQVAKTGATVQVRIMSADVDRERLELGIKQASDDWVPAGKPGSQDTRSSGSLGTFADLLSGFKLPK